MISSENNEKNQEDAKKKSLELEKKTNCVFNAENIERTCFFVKEAKFVLFRGLASIRTDLSLTVLN